MKLRNFNIGNSETLTLMGGMNVLESRDLAMHVAEKFKESCEKYNINYIFKGSFDKANRSSINSFRGPGLEEGLKILQEVSNSFDVPVITDIHEADQAKPVSEVCEVVQIPAFLARQTDLLVAAAKSGKIVNIKKGQFMDSKSMSYAVDKVLQSGNNNVLITERGSMFGYQDLIVDFRNIPKMKVYAPVILDVTHSLQKPNQESGVTGGQPDLIETIAKAGIVTGADGIFIETHSAPKSAKSDGKNMLPIEDLDELISKLVRIKSSI